mmetsp:Transcript_36470/g.58418  ORF Transcript_36470/g.58418 Transcript_36470/m.58418 type:complete len:235 (-) Transcript_36470:271-975(-)
MPNPSIELTSPQIPTPMLKTKGTVTGPVVTPALSQAIQQRPSSTKIVRHNAIVYPTPRTNKRSIAYRTFAKPSTIPKPTPEATLKMRSRLVNTPLLSFSTVSPRPHGSKSITVAINPATNPKIITDDCPRNTSFSAATQLLNILPESAIGKFCPACSPRGTLPYVKPMLNTKSPTRVAKKPCKSCTGCVPAGRSCMSKPCTTIKKLANGPTARQLCQSSLRGNSVHALCSTWRE